MKTMRVVAMALAATVLLTGCGGSDDEPSAKPSEAASSAADGSGGFDAQDEEACDLLTEDVAAEVLGPSPAKTPATPGADTADISVTQCSWTNGSKGVTDLQLVSLLVRAAKTETGATSNEAVFGDPLKPEGAEDVDGYGEQAYWNPGAGQLNVLRDGNWYILSAGAPNPRDHKLDDAKALADALGIF